MSNKKIKICYVSNEGGSFIHDTRFLKKFVEKKYEKYEIHYISLRKKINMLSDSEKIKGIFYYEPDENYPFKNRIFKKIINPLNGEENLAIPYWYYPIVYFKKFLFLISMLRNIKPQILHGGWVPISGFLCALTRYKPFLLMPFGHDILYYEKQSFIVKCLTKYAIRNSDMITVDAEIVKDHIVENFGYPSEKIITFPWGVDRSTFNSSVQSDIRHKLGWQNNKILIMNRSFTRRLDIPTFIHSLPLIISKNKDVRVLMVGDGPQLEYIKNLVSSLFLDDYVYFAGYVDNTSEMPAYLAASDIYVTTSLSDGSSVSLMEAIACGLPSVVTDVPAFFEWITDGSNGFMVPKKQSKALAERINYILSSPYVLSSMRISTLRVADEKADWDKNFNKLEGIYHNLIS